MKNMAFYNLNLIFGISFVIGFAAAFSNAQSINDKWIVVTTINYPTESLKKLSKQPGWQIVVVADKKTPKDWSLSNCVFLSPEIQESLGYKIVKVLPWNHYCRKNIGYLYAIQHGANIIYETDDDNILLEPLTFLPKQSEIKMYKTNSIVVNPYRYFGQPNVWPRGYPLEHISNKEPDNFHSQIVSPLIQQGLVNNDPDVDAIFRLTRGEYIFFNNMEPVGVPENVFCPFNSQNTLFHYAAFWGLLIPMTTTFRVCDIWRGYVTQRLLWDIHGTLCLTRPTAIQDRNIHNLLRDFSEEIDLYYHAGRLINFLKSWKSNESNLSLRFLELTRDMIKEGFYQAKELELAQAWFEDLKTIGWQLDKSSHY